MTQYGDTVYQTKQNGPVSVYVYFRMCPANCPDAIGRNPDTIGKNRPKMAYF